MDLYFLVKTVDISFLQVEIPTGNYKDPGICPAVTIKNFTPIVMLS
jgi:hypothetical protein